MLKTLCNTEVIAAALQRGALPFIQFFSAGNTHPARGVDDTTSVVAAVTTPKSLFIVSVQHLILFGF